MNKKTIIGLIPARSGSKRCPNKNIRPLSGHPLIAWTIKSALESRIFTDIVVSTDSEETMEIASSYGASAILRPAEISQDTSTDYEWVTHTIKTLDCKEDAFGILRPTNPFRTAETIKACWNQFRYHSEAAGLRTIKCVKEHPNKMWRHPYIGGNNVNTIIEPVIYCVEPLYDLPTQSLFEAYVQDGLFYIGLINNILEYKSICGYPIIGHVTNYPENLDINTEQDFLIAQENAWILKK